MRRGQQWELTCELWHRQYAREGRAYIVKAHPGAKMVGGRLIYESVGPPDFVGTLCGGRSVAFDAKEVQGMRMPLSNVKGHQANALESFAQMGGFAFILVQWMDKDRVTNRTLHRWERFGPLFRAWQAGEGPASLTPFDGELLPNPTGAGEEPGRGGWLPLLQSSPR